MHPIKVPTQQFDLERILQQHYESACPPEALLISSEESNQHILALSLQFLEDGQRLPCPGLPLAGAGFAPGWGFREIEIARGTTGRMQFRPPSRWDDGQGDLWGYRLCPLEDAEIARTIYELASIRAALGSVGTQAHDGGDSMVAISIV
ncbi:MAG TPA: hypothetical protein VN612_08895 [Acidobacteriaceae bacterium]|nr:hypothetical protein [Acidobacteriaceae bacterium]